MEEVIKRSGKHETDMYSRPQKPSAQYRPSRAGPFGRENKHNTKKTGGWLAGWLDLYVSPSSFMAVSDHRAHETPNSQPVCAPSCGS